MSKRPGAFNSPLDGGNEDDGDYEAFDLNTDFKDGQFGDDGEFYFSEKRGPRNMEHMSKEDRRQRNKDRAIYGDLLDVSLMNFENTHS